MPPERNRSHCMRLGQLEIRAGRDFGHNRPSMTIARSDENRSKIVAQKRQFGDMSAVADRQNARGRCCRIPKGPSGSILNIGKIDGGALAEAGDRTGD
jgi:hypothetical protein